MSPSEILLDLQMRGLVAQVTDPKSFVTSLEQAVTLYCGFDPSADSLHVGHLLPILTLKRFQEAGHRPIVLIGGATGMIGDPSFKSQERKLQTADEVKASSERIGEQLARFLSFEGPHGALLANNADWFAQMNVLQFLREVGKHFSINAMINKDFVKQRIDQSEAGISFTEFSYSLLQAYDFVALNKQYNCLLQIGGSDQWGNITAGIDLVRRLQKQAVYGLTLPLLTKSDGTKFGKTEQGSVWLDPQKTSPYAFYQFWLSIDDADIERSLKYFTFLSLDEIAAIQANKKVGEPQKRLAEEMTCLVHGKNGLLSAQRITEFLFDFEQRVDLDEHELAQIISEFSLIYSVQEHGTLLIDLLVISGLCASKSQARQLIEAGAIRLNKHVISDIHYQFKKDDFILHSNYAILTRGKKAHVVICGTVQNA